MASGTKVKAVVDGQFQVQTVETPSKEDLTIITIQGLNNLLVTYRFKGQVSQDVKSDTKVNVGQVLGSLSGNEFGEKLFGKKYDLVISIQELNSQDFLKLQSLKNGISF